MKFIKNLLLLRLPVHSNTNNSNISIYIQNYCVTIDQLMYHIESKDILSYLNVISDIIDDNKTIRKCVFAARNEDKTIIKKNYRNMIYDIWRRALSKTQGVVRGMYEAIKTKNINQIFLKLSTKLDLEINQLNDDIIIIWSTFLRNIIPF